MQFNVTIAGRTQRVELRRTATGWECGVDGQPLAADVVEVRPGAFSILVGGQAFEIHVERDNEHYRVHSRDTDLVAAVEDPRRWHGSRAGGLAAEGRQEIQAPMSGKVIEVLVEEGQSVEAGQGLVVVEAMKMQNAIPAPKNGMVERVLVRAGDTVEHGATLLVVS